MKRRVAAFGALLLVLALYLATNPLESQALAGSVGLNGSTVVVDQTRVMTVDALNSSYFGEAIPSGGSLTVSLVADPGGIDVLVLNQGNFSLWAQGGGGSYSTYAQSRLDVSNYSFAFAPARGGTYFVVLVSHQRSASTQALVRYSVTAPSYALAFLVPSSLGAVGILALALSLWSRGGKALPAQAQPRAPAADGPPAEPAAPSCAHCGSPLQPGSAFCPGCGRSQA